jgi:hypothetical protein
MNQDKQPFLKQAALLLIATSIVYSCNNSKAKKALVTTEVQIQSTSPATGSLENKLKIDSLPANQIKNTSPREEFIVIPSFEVKVNLSEAAEEKLKKDKETILVGADFSGIPKDKSSDYYRHLGWIEVASTKKELKNSRQVVFNNIKYSKTIYDSLADKDIQVNIYVVSGRRSNKNNLLDTDLISEKMSRAKGKKFVITGRLIEEVDSTESY